MADETTLKKKKKKRSPLGKRQLSPSVTSSNLWIPDKQLFQETARKRHMSDAELLREIVHRWCVVERRAPGSQEDEKELALINLQKETKATVEEGTKQISDLLTRLLEATSGYGDLLSLNEAQLSHVTNVGNAHYNVTAQTFAALWSLVEMFQRFYFSSMLRDDQKSLSFDKDAHTKVVAITDNIRAEGLRMVAKIVKDCGSPAPIKMNLICPTGSE